MNAAQTAVRRKLSPFLLTGTLLAAAVFILDAGRRAPFEVLEVRGRDAEIQTPGQGWKKLEAGSLFTSQSLLRTAKNTTVLLEASEDIRVLVGADSSVKGMGPRFRDSGGHYRFDLLYGKALFAAGERLESRGQIEVFTPKMRIHAAGGLWGLEADAASGREWAGVLEGGLRLDLRDGSEPALDVRALESFELLSPNQSRELIREEASARRQMFEAGEVLHLSSALKPAEWKTLFPIYEIKPRYGETHRLQNLITRQGAGDLFDFIYDHGDFYTPQQDFARRTFFVTPGDGVHLYTYYDVFRPGGFAGIYMKARDLSAGHFQALEFEVRRAAGRPYPALVHVEMKREMRILKRFTLRDIGAEWSLQRFELGEENASGVDEIVFYFRHEDVGAHKQGWLEFRNFRRVRP